MSEYQSEQKSHEPAFFFFNDLEQEIYFSKDHAANPAIKCEKTIPHPHHSFLHKRQLNA